MTHAKAIKENDSEFADFTQMKVKRFNRTNLWTGNMTFYVDIGNDYEVNYVFKNNENITEIILKKLAGRFLIQEDCKQVPINTLSN